MTFRGYTGLKTLGLLGIILAGLLQGCGSLLSDGGDPSCLLSITSDSGTGQVLYTGHDVAQSFVVQSQTTVSSVGLKLVIASTDGVTYPNGNLNVFLERDSVSSLTYTPTLPSGTPLGGASNYGTINVATLSLTQASFFSTTLPSPVSLTPGVYWVHVYTTIPSNNNVKVYWRNSATQVASGFAAVAGAAVSPAIDMLTLINCSS